jgi:tetratricopeptide (TPR) repeat protein
MKVRFVRLFVTLFYLAAPLTAQNPADTLWQDPAFIKSFIGSYGFLAGAEPEVAPEEVEALRDLITIINVRPKAAIEQLEQQITADSSAAFDFILANLYFQQGQLREAEKRYKIAIEKYPDFRRAYKNLGLLQAQDNNFEDAVVTISTALEKGVVDGRAYGLLGYGYLTQELYYPAEAAYRQAILIQPEVEDWKIGLARCLLQTEQYTDAIALFDTLIKESPNNADYWILQSNAYLGKNDSLAAAQNLEIVRRMGKAELETLTLLGDIYMNNELPDLALDAYLAASDRAKQKDFKAILRAASLLNRSGNNEQANIMITRIRDNFGQQLNEDQELELLTLEAKIARASGDDATAIATLNEIVKRDSLNGEALIELGKYYAEQGDMARAITRFQEAEKIEVFERPALIAHAQALVREGDYVKAIPMLQRALQIESEPNLQEYARRVERAASSTR